ncbi:MAG: PAS domain S-box protein [Planctomycetota bacterium]|nr:PAS domain S-box protein [Planctomycetota bacterium]
MTEDLTPPEIDDRLRRIHALAAGLDNNQAQELRALVADLETSLNDRLRAERDLRSDGSRYRTLFDDASDAMVRSDLDGNIIEANPAMARMLGCDNSADVLGLTMNQIWANPDERKQAITEILSKRRLVKREGTARRADDGTEFLVRVNATLVCDADGTPRYIDSIAEDITERRAAELALRASEERYRVLVETSHDLIFTIDANGVIENVNSRGMKDMTGRDLDEVVGHHFLEFVVEEGLADAVQHLSQLSSSLDILNFENAIRHKDGRTIPLAVRVAPIIDSTGTFTGAVGTCIDLTSNRELQAQLAQAQKMQAIGQLAGGMAHDFNNQLAGIGGYSELLLEELEPSSKAGRHAQQIHTLARRGSALTRKLLTFARQDGEPTKRLDLHEIIDEVVPLLELGSAGHIDVQRQFDASNSIVQGDPALIGNAILNLLVNARDAMTGGGTITLSTRNGDRDLAKQAELTCDEVIELRVRDTGHGMDEATQVRIFEPFFTTKQPGTGTGIGLSTVYGTVRSHEGAISVTSTPGSGTTFTITLPTVSGAAEDSSSGKRRAIGRGQGRVLIAEDDQAVREVLEEALTRYGFQPEAHEDGLAAVQRFRAEPSAWRMVVLDLTMPRMDGEQALTAIRAINDAVPVLVVSGNVSNEVVKRLVAAGARVLRKPFALRDLVLAIDEMTGA